MSNFHENSTNSSRSHSSNNLLINNDDPLSYSSINAENEDISKKATTHKLLASSVKKSKVIWTFWYLLKYVMIPALIPIAIAAPLAFISFRVEGLIFSGILNLHLINYWVLAFIFLMDLIYLCHWFTFSLQPIANSEALPTTEDFPVHHRTSVFAPIPEESSQDLSQSEKRSTANAIAQGFAMGSNRGSSFYTGNRRTSMMLGDLASFAILNAKQNTESVNAVEKSHGHNFHKEDQVAKDFSKLNMSNSKRNNFMDSFNQSISGAFSKPLPSHPTKITKTIVYDKNGILEPEIQLRELPKEIQNEHYESGKSLSSLILSHPSLHAAISQNLSLSQSGSINNLDESMNLSKNSTGPTRKDTGAFFGDYSYKKNEPRKLLPQFNEEEEEEISLETEQLEKTETKESFEYVDQKSKESQTNSVLDIDMPNPSVSNPSLHAAISQNLSLSQSGSINNLDESMNLSKNSTGPTRKDTGAFFSDNSYKKNETKNVLEQFNEEEEEEEIKGKSEFALSTGSEKNINAAESSHKIDISSKDISLKLESMTSIAHSSSKYSMENSPDKDIESKTNSEDLIIVNTAIRSSSSQDIFKSKSSESVIESGSGSINLQADKMSIPIRSTSDLSNASKSIPSSDSSEYEAPKPLKPKAPIVAVADEKVQLLPDPPMEKIWSPWIYQTAAQLLFRCVVIPLYMSFTTLSTLLFLCTYPLVVIPGGIIAHMFIIANRVYPMISRLISSTMVILVTELIKQFLFYSMIVPLAFIDLTNVEGVLGGILKAILFLISRNLLKLVVIQSDRQAVKAIRAKELLDADAIAEKLAETLTEKDETLDENRTDNSFEVVYEDEITDLTYFGQLILGLGGHGIPGWIFIFRIENTFSFCVAAAGSLFVEAVSTIVYKNYIDWTAKRKQKQFTKESKKTEGMMAGPKLFGQASQKAKANEKLKLQPESVQNYMKKINFNSNIPKKKFSQASISSVPKKGAGKVTPDNRASIAVKKTGSGSRHQSIVIKESVAEKTKNAITNLAKASFSQKDNRRAAVERRFVMSSTYGAIIGGAAIYLISISGSTDQFLCSDYGLIKWDTLLWRLSAVLSLQFLVDWWFTFTLVQWGVPFAFTGQIEVTFVQGFLVAALTILQSMSVFMAHERGLLGQCSSNY